MEKSFTGTVIDALGREYQFTGNFENVGTELSPYWKSDNQEQIDYLEVLNMYGDLLSQNEIQDNDLYNAIEFEINEEV